MRVYPSLFLFVSSVVVLWSGILPAAAAVVVPPDGPEQMPLIYVHGYIDDGTGWARDSLYLLEEDHLPLSAKYARHYWYGPDSSAAQFFSRAGMPNWAVQWWSANTDGGYARPDSSEEDGWAFLQTAEELLRGTDWVFMTWSAQNRPIPSAMEVLTSKDFDLLNCADWLIYSPVLGAAECSGWLIDLPFKKEIAKIVTAARLQIRNTYNDAGQVDPRAGNLLDLLRRERRPGGNLEEWRQVNLITHSMGSLVTRAMLHKAKEASREDSEYVANVVYNAPPFAGSTMAYIGEWIFGPAEFTSAQFADPFVNKLFQEAAGSGADTLETAMDYFDMNLQLTLRPIGFDVVAFKESLPGWASAPVALLENIPVGSEVPLSDLVDTPVGNAIAGALNLVRPLAAGLTGMDGRPGVVDLTPSGGVRHLTDYTTNPDVNQFVTLGRVGFDVHLFPDDLQAVAANPDLLTDVDAQSAQMDDTAVAVGSARLLTETDAFGPRMKLLGEFNHTHPEMLYGNLRGIGPTWLEALLAAPTTLRLEGEVLEVDSAGRSYLVERTSAFSLESESVTRTVDLPPLPSLPGFEVSVTANAVGHEYRVAPADGSGVEPSHWVTLGLGASVNFGALVDAHGLTNSPFFLEWRSINERGGKEMIRSARIAVAAEAPQVVQVLFHTPSEAEVHKNPRNSAIAAGAVRGSLVSQVAGLSSGQEAILSAIRARPEASYVLSHPETKAFTAIFDKRGEVEYVWDDETFSDPERRDGVNALFLPLAGLAEGPHTLYFETITETSVGGATVEKRSPRQRISVLVDTTPPSIQFLGDVNHPVARVVGPSTPLRFTVEDVGSNGGTGEMTVPGHPDGIVPANMVFTLGETDLKARMEVGGIAGGLVNLTVTARDGVNNSVTETIEVYYDIAPPEIGLAGIVGALPAGTNTFTTVAREVELAVNVSDAAAGFLPPEVQVGSPGSGLSGVVEPLVRGAVAGYSDAFGGKIPLSPGENTVVVTVRDFGDNVGTLVLTVHSVAEISDGEPVRLLSPRLEAGTFFDENGEPVAAFPGGISHVTSSFHGEVFAFSSAGNHFVGGDTNSGNDTNRIDDVFVWEDGGVRRVSVTAEGGQANGHSNQPAVSGNGRYLVFRSAATNLVPGVDGGAYELYLRDLRTGEIALVSRAVDGNPAGAGNVDSYQGSAMTFSGRYVFFSSRASNLAAGVADTNNNLDVFAADLDPDGNGYFFDGDYEIHLLSRSASDPNVAANGRSRDPTVSRDGRHLVFISNAQNIHGQVATNPANTNNAIRVSFSGSDESGDLDFASGDVFPVNRAEAFFAPGETVTLTAGGVDDAAISPLGPTAIFSSRSNVDGTGDINSQTSGRDIYLSLGNPESPFLAWSSRSFDVSSPAAMQSSETINTLVPVSLGAHEPLGAGYHKVAWVSTHNNIEPNDGNGVADLFIRINDSGVARSDLRVINWLSNSQPSGAPVLSGGVTPDGRYAWWVSTQKYTSPYATNGPANLYVRRLDPDSAKVLTVAVFGEGSVVRSLEGSAADGGGFEYGDEEKVALAAIPAAGFRFVRWEGVDWADGSAAWVRTNRDRAVMAIFEAVSGPQSASAEIVMLQGATSEGVSPRVIGGEGQALVLSIVSQPENGKASVRHNLLHYTPAPGFAGADLFLFQVSNEFGQTLPDPAVASVVVVPVNLPPSSTSLAMVASAGTEGLPVSPVVEDSTDGDSFTFTILTQPANGVATVEDGQLVYTPNAGFTGTDSFSYRVTDSAGGTTTGIAEIEVATPQRIDRQIIRHLEATESAFRVEFETESGFAYTVDYKDSLEDSLWHPVGAFIGNGQTAEFVDNDVEGPSRFYRIRRQPVE